MRVLLDECLPKKLKRLFVAKFEIGVIVIAAPNNTLEALQPLVAAVLQALASLKNGQVLELGG